MASNMSLNLEQLPPELLTEIAGYLVSYWTALKCFSLVSARCYAASEVHRFREIHVRAYSRKRLMLDVQEAMRVLESHNRYRYVRKIVVSGTMPLPHHDHDKIGTSQEGRWFVGHDDLPSTYDTFGNANKKANEEAFEPLVRLLHCTPNVKFFDFGSRGAIPITLVRRLNALPNCKLKLLNFYIRDPQIELSDDERELIDSPCLYEIRAEIHPALSDRHPDFPSYISESLTQLVSGPQAKLRNVVLEGYDDEIEYEEETYQKSLPLPPKEPWRGLAGMLPTSAPPSVSGLVLRGNAPSVPAWLDKLQLNSLQHLSLSFCMHSWEEFGWLRSGQEFTSLRTLDLRHVASIGEAFNNQLIHFLLQVNQLSTLQLRGIVIGDSLIPSIERHRSSLVTLGISFWSKTEAGSIQRFLNGLAHAPKLETLFISIPEGHAISRVQLFAALARIPFLDDLALAFQAEGDPTDPSLALLKQFVDLRPSLPESNQDIPTAAFNHLFHSDAKLEYIRQIYGDMVLTRIQDYPDIRWLSKFQLILKRDPQLDFFIERDWVHLQSFQEEVMKVQLRESSFRGNVKLFPCEYCKSKGDTEVG